MVDARLPSGERVNVIIPPLSLTGPTLTIRRFPAVHDRGAGRTRGRSIGLDRRRCSASCVRATAQHGHLGRHGRGQDHPAERPLPGSPVSEHIITVEDSAELHLQQPHVISLEARPPTSRGRGEVRSATWCGTACACAPTASSSARCAAPRRFDMLQAMNTGHEGSLVTVHANSAEDAIVRLETLASMSDV